MSLFTVLEELAAGANPVLALDQDARKLVSRFLDDEFQKREVVEDVRLDGLLKFGARQRFLQNFREQLAKHGMLGGLGRLASFIAPVEEAHVDDLPNQVEKVGARQFHETRA